MQLYWGKVLRFCSSRVEILQIRLFGWNQAIFENNWRDPFWGIEKRNGLVFTCKRKRIGQDEENSNVVAKLVEKP